MAKIAVVVLADTAGDDGLGRIVNALTAAKEFHQAGDDTVLIFSGAGTKWLAALAKPDHPVAGLFLQVKGLIKGACKYCSTAFKVAAAASEAKVSLLHEFGENMSYRVLLQSGYQVLIF